jgi:squalene-hopene/tetraprenyl-beta-curcumene cyclase
MRRVFAAGRFPSYRYAGGAARPEGDWWSYSLLVLIVSGLALAAVGCSRNDPRPATHGSWDPGGAAAYLDRRMNWWMGWGTAARDHGTFCVSCHTAVPYALARSTLGATLGSDSPGNAERRLIEDVRRRVRLSNDTAPYYTDQYDAPGKSTQSRGTESVLNALILAYEDARSGRLSPDTRIALDDMWALQSQRGDDAGAWSWLDFSLAPWESPDAQYYGAALAALAVGVAPERYRAEPQVQDHLRLLHDYLGRHYAAQSLHHRLVLLWASAKLPGLLDPDRRRSLIEEALRAQNSDGGWSLSMLASTSTNRRLLLRDSASDGYATGLATLALEEGGMPSADKGVERGLSWLAQHQGGHLGRWFRGKESFWVARSLNQRRNPWSNVGRFMTDAATGYAVLALSNAPRSTRFAQR